MLERYLAAGDIAGLCRELETLLQESLACEVELAFGGYDCHIPQTKDAQWIKLAPELDYAVSCNSMGTGAGGISSSSPESGTFNFERLYDDLQKSVGRQLVEQAEAIVGQCFQVIDEMERSVVRLQDALTRQDSAFLELKRQLRDALR
jgi:hypothetical protein